MTTPDPGTLAVRLRTQSGSEVLRPTVAELSVLIDRIGGEGDHFLVLERVPYARCVFIQVYRDKDAVFTIEYRDGGLDQYSTELSDARDVSWLLTAWAGEQPAWISEVDWKPSYRHPRIEVTPLSAVAKRCATSDAWRFLDQGHLDFEQMAQAISERASPQDPVTIEQAETLLEPLWAQRVAEQRSWPQITDVDRIEAALAGLSGRGVTARAHCRECGTGEIGAESADGDHGFVFFHHEDTERAVGGELRLTFGAHSNTESDGVAVGQEVVKALAAEGLSYEWDGTLEQPITVVGLDWKKRLE